MEVDVVGEGVELQGKCHALEDHLLVEVWGAKSCLTKAIYERSEWFALFLSNAQEGDRAGLVWAAASEVCGEHVREDVEPIDGVRWKGCEPFEGRALEGGGEGFAEDFILGRVQGDMSDVDFEVLFKVGFASISVQGERFPLGGKRGVGDKVGEGVTTPGLVGREQMGWDWMSDHSGEGRSKVVRGDVACWRVLWIVWWNMCGV